MKEMFNSKEQLLNYGEENLYESFCKEIEGMEEKYIIKAHNIREEFYKLFGFKSNEELIEKLNNKPVLELKPYLRKLSENIISDLEDKNTLISKYLYNSWNGCYKDLEIKFIAYNSCDDDIVELEFGIMSYQKVAGHGSGCNFNFDIIDSEKLKMVTNEINNMDISDNIKSYYLDYINSNSNEYISVDSAKGYLVEDIVNVIDDYICMNEEDYKTHRTLKNQGIIEKISEKLSDFKPCSIVDDLTFNYPNKWDYIWDDEDNFKYMEDKNTLDENKIEISLLGEVIKTIRKTSYTVYEIK